MSRLSSQTVREAEDYLNKYRHMNLEPSQQMGWRVMAAIEAQVTPSPPPSPSCWMLSRQSLRCGASSRHWLIVAVGSRPALAGL